jgi:hypothetical protein
MNKNVDSVKDFILTKYSQKDLLANKRVEAQRYTGLLTNLQSVINDLSLNDLSVILEYKRFLEWGPSTNINQGHLYFRPSPIFVGQRPGWVFKNGEHGIGYYIDI